MGRPDSTSTAPGADNDTSTSHDSDGSPEGDPRAADGQPQNPDARKPDDTVERVVRERLAREKRKHERELAEARAAAVREFRAQHALSDETLEAAGSQMFASLHAEKAKLEAELAAFREKDAREREERRQAALRTAVLEAAEGLHDDPEAAEFLISRLSTSLTVADDGTVSGEAGCNARDIVRDYLLEHPWLAKPSGNHNGAGSRGSERPLDGLRRVGGEQMTDADKARQWARYARNR